ncbi:hypothetical protein PR048_017232 [Dryococelus australis]|uniref:Uncharacterized protein n=1 Tax=Dryococelus australis TaxID=614101 RepID=A0ABQ9H900_9NEOP|nr:hypothetical protein PR048_017232 [Dryococelus australis]
MEHQDKTACNKFTKNICKPTAIHFYFSVDKYPTQGALQKKTSGGSVGEGSPERLPLEGWKLRDTAGTTHTGRLRQAALLLSRWRAGAREQALRHVARPGRARAPAVTPDACVTQVRICAHLLPRTRGLASSPAKGPYLVHPGCDVTLPLSEVTARAYYAPCNAPFSQGHEQLARLESQTVFDSQLELGRRVLGDCSADIRPVCNRKTMWSSANRRKQIHDFAVTSEWLVKWTFRSSEPNRPRQSRLGHVIARNEGIKGACEPDGYRRPYFDSPPPLVFHANARALVAGRAVGRSQPRYIDLSLPIDQSRAARARPASRRSRSEVCVARAQIRGHDVVDTSIFSLPDNRRLDGQIPAQCVEHTRSRTPMLAEPAKWVRGGDRGEGSKTS